MKQQDWNQKVMNYIDTELVEAADHDPHRAKPSYHTALIAAIVMCIILCTTALAASTEMDYCMWAAYETNLSAANNVLLKEGFGLQFPETLETYTFDHMQKGYVVPEGTIFLAAVTGDAVYMPKSITYLDCDDADGSTAECVTQRSLNISVGRINSSYWSTYFGYDPENLVFVPDGQYLADVEIREYHYKGNTVYLFEPHTEPAQSPFQRATWVSQNLGLCFAVSLGLSGWQDDISTVPAEAFPGDILPYVEMIIDFFEE